MKRYLPLLSLVFTTILNGATVVWTANGTVTSVTGNYQASVPVDIPMSVEMRYDDQAGKEVVKITPIGPFVLVESDFRTAINLEISVTIGGSTWQGEIESGGNALPRTFFMKTSNTSNADTLAVSLHPADGATFTQFPNAVGGEVNQINLNFSSTDHSFLTDAILASSYNVAAAESANGSFQSGPGNKVSFTLDHTSMTIENEFPPPPVPVLSLSRTGDNLAISWESVFDVNYQLQSSLTMEEGSWINTGSMQFGNGGTLNRNVAIIEGFNLYYRVVATPAPEL